MKPDVAVDVGNTRIKWGRCSSDAVEEKISLPGDDPDAWGQQLTRWGGQHSAAWAVAGVHPERVKQLTDWLQGRGHTVLLIDAWQRLPLKIGLEHPGRVGIDRLLDAVAVNSRRRPGTPAAIIDAGSAVTVDWLDEQGVFRGGAILPGLDLMAQALHEHTALLPLVPIPTAAPPVPATSTPKAIETGIFWAVAGGVRAIVDQLSVKAGASPQVFLTGGHASLLASVLDPSIVHWPNMTLEGIRLSAMT